MQFNAEQVVLSTQKQLLDLWFAVYLLKGHRVSQAARRSHAQSLQYLRDVGVSEAELPAHLVSEAEWVQEMLATTPGRQ